LRGIVIPDHADLKF